MGTRTYILCSNRYAQTIEAGYVFLPEVYLAKNRDLPWRGSNVNQRPALIGHFKQFGINERRCHGWRDHNGNEHLHPWCGKVDPWFPPLLRAEEKRHSAFLRAEAAHPRGTPSFKTRPDSAA